MRLRVIEEDEVGICRGCRCGTVMKVNGESVRHCSEINRIFEGKVTECSSYSPVGSKQLGDEDIPSSNQWRLQEEVGGRITHIYEE